MSFWRHRRVLITGGASFIGSHLSEALVQAGARVRVADDLSSGRLAHLREVRSDVEFLRGDLRDGRFTARACRGMSVVFHLAASHGGRGYIDTHPAACALNAVIDGMVFDHAVRAGVDHLCFASSACVYPVGLQADARRTVRLRERDADHAASAQPDGPYGWAKWMGELSLAAQHRQHGIGASICRLFTVYGERAYETHAIPALMAKARLRLDPYPVWGTGTQRRNFTYVSDAVSGLLLAAEHIGDARPVNIGSDEVVTLDRLARAICALTGFSPRAFHFERGRPVGVANRAANTSRARAHLGWRAQVRLLDGLARTLAWHCAHRPDATLRRKFGALLTER